MRKEGKVITKITYYKNGHHIEMELRLIKAGDKFTYSIQHDEPAISVRNDDPNVAEKMARAELDRTLTIEWKKVLVLEVDITHEYCRAYSSGGVERGTLDGVNGRRSVGITVTSWGLGKTNDGKDVHRSNMEDDRHEISQGLPRQLRDLAQKRVRGLPDASVAVIDDNPENRARIQAVLDALDLLGERLLGLLGQEQVLATLANVQAIGLPAPKQGP